MSSIYCFSEFVNRRIRRKDLNRVTAKVAIDMDYIIVSFMVTTVWLVYKFRWLPPIIYTLYSTTDEPLYQIIKEYLALELRMYILKKLESGVLIKHRDIPYTDLIYHDGIDRYTIRFHRSRTPKKFTKVMGKIKKEALEDDVAEELIDVTPDVVKFMGPYSNFHTIPTTPHILGYEELTFIDTIRDISMTFRKNDVIDILPK